MWDVIIGLLSIEAVQTALSVILVAIIALITRSVWWARHVVGIALSAYEYAEAEGLVQGLKGHEKLKPFMDRFTAEFREKFGRAPSAQDRAKAVEAMEKQVQKEHGGAAALAGF